MPRKVRRRTLQAFSTSEIRTNLERQDGIFQETPAKLENATKTKPESPYNPNLATTPQPPRKPPATETFRKAEKSPKWSNVWHNYVKPFGSIKRGLPLGLQKLIFSKSNFIIPQSIFAIQKNKSPRQNAKQKTAQDFSRAVFAFKRTETTPPYLAAGTKSTASSSATTIGES